MDKLVQLREHLATAGFAAFIVPHTDEFQGEFISPHADRLQWLTGFTGSAGMAVVTQNKAAFFTDGRYTLQAKKEVPSSYEIYNTSDKTASQWLQEILGPDDKVGYDPGLFTEAQLQRYTSPLVPISPNPIDELWTDRPPAPRDFIQRHPLDFAGENSESKRIRIGAGLKADQVLITACDSIAWLLNIRGNDVPHTPLVHSVCLLRKDGSYDLFVDLIKMNGEAYAYLQQGGGRVIEYAQVLTHLSALRGSCQVDPQTTPVAIVETLKKAGVSLQRETDPCTLLKAIKNKVEIEGAKAAHLQDGIALCCFFAWLEKHDATELSAAAQLREFRQQGQYFKDLSFEAISGFGAHGAIIHYRVTPSSDCSLQGNGLYLLDSGGQYLNGTTDVTRTIAIGTPTAEQKDRYTRVLKGHIALAQAVFPKGTTGSQVDPLARQFLWQVGEDYVHGTGHGVGSYLGVHEGPHNVSPRHNATPLSPGMILSNEPGYYKEGEYGIRIENLMVVVEKFNGFYGFETLTLVPLDKRLIEMSLLTELEKEWIATYHQRIFKTLSPHVEGEALVWLQGAQML